jgi:hypothetical protein
MEIFQNAVFQSVFVFLTSILAKSVVIAIRSADEKIHVYADPKEGARMLEESGQLNMGLISPIFARPRVGPTDGFVTSLSVVVVCLLS